VCIVGQRALGQQITRDASHCFAHQARERVGRVWLMGRLAVSVRAAIMLGERRLGAVDHDGAIREP